jgi:RNase P subunit RPR2
MEKLTKSEAEEKIKKAFYRKLSPKEVRKVKRLAMKHNIKLGSLRKKFCKKCCSLLEGSKVRIKNKTKTVRCKNCSYVNRWKLKTS